MVVVSHLFSLFSLLKGKISGRLQFIRTTTSPVLDYRFPDSFKKHNILKMILFLTMKQIYIVMVRINPIISIENLPIEKIFWHMVRKNM